MAKQVEVEKEEKEEENRKQSKVRPFRKQNWLKEQRLVCRLNGQSYEVRR